MVKMDDKKIKKKKKNNSCGEHVHVLPEAYVGD